LFGENEFGGIALQHTSGTPGTASFLLSDAMQTKTATVAVSGSASAIHTIAGVYDGTNLTAYSDGVGGSNVTGLVIPSPNLNPPDALTGSVGVGTNVPFL